MENANIKINLAALVHIETKVRGRNGDMVEGIFLPYEKNHIFKGTKTKSLDLIAFPLKSRKPESKETHIIKQSFSKEQREKMSQDQIDNLPIIGNLIDWSSSPNVDPDIDPAQPLETSSEAKDDLPF
ncbi:MAG: hypothetical protein AB7C90_04325 [Bacteroidales bacterium]